MVATLSVILLGILEGILVAVTLSILCSSAVLQCEAVTDIDVTAADMLERLDVELNDAGVNLAFVELRGRLEDLLHRYGLFATIDRRHVFPSIDTALAGISADGASPVERGGASEDDPPEIPDALPPPD